MMGWLRLLFCSFLIIIKVTCARPVQKTDPALTWPARTLQQSAVCPDGCMEGQCSQDATSAGLRCLKCVGELLVDHITGQCVCPVGRYSPSGTQTCVDCPKGSYCIGSDYRHSAQPPSVPTAIPCPPNMTTLGMRSPSERACVNLPGFYYTLNGGQPRAVQCPVNTYGPGLKKQHACVPCPTGFTTDFRVQQTKPQACIVPAGYYLKSPGQVAPCPQGEWKADVGASGNCTKCAHGVTTAHEASTSEAECRVLQPGYYAREISPEGVIKQAQPCPQKYFCPGGIPTSAFDPSTPGALSSFEGSIKLCPNGTWTLGYGATDLAQCMTPPGFFTASGTTQPCPAGCFRANWRSHAPTCQSCGEGVKAAKTDRISVYSIVDYTEAFLEVTTSSEDCYIQPGQGLYYQMMTQTYRARNCDSNNYGVTNITYGLTPSPCRDCPLGQIASSNSSRFPNSASYFVRNPDGSGGFVTVKACVNLPGYGYNGERRISEQCLTGSYSAGDSNGACVSCPEGFTTAGPGVGVTEADCGVAAGYGNVNGTIRPCPIGTYNPVPWSAGTNVTCTPCPSLTTTAQEGTVLADGCNLCVPGYGGDKCMTQCGGVGPLATYGPPGRTIGSPCLPCSTSKTGFSYDWNMQNDLFQANAISRAGADRPCDCLSEFQQMVDAAWYIKVSATAVNSTAPANSFKECVAQCTGPHCVWVTYNYVTKECYKRISPLPMDGNGVPYVAIKAMPSGDLTITPYSATGKPVNSTADCTVYGGVNAKAVTSGQYTFFRDVATHEILGTEPAPGRDNFTLDQQCLTTCDFDDRCAGVILLDVQPAADRPKTCELIKGDPTLGVFLRTMTRTDVTRLGRGQIPT